MSPHCCPVAQAPGARPRARMLAAATAAGLLLGWAAGPAPARQTPAAWTGGAQAVLPSGLTVRLEFAPLPGIDAAAAPGVLGGRTGDTAAYTDGIRPGDPAETFRMSDPHPQQDGSWRALGTLRIAFSRPVRNARLHVSGLTARAAAATGTTTAAARLVLAEAAPAAPALTARTAWTGWTVDGGTVAPPADGAADSAGDGSGSLELGGTVSSVTLRVERRTTARNGSTTPAPALGTAVTVGLDESLGTAPAGYGNASHLRSDLALGRDAGAPAGPAADGSRPAPPAEEEPAARRPLVELAPGR
ncbi:hypothetical protein ACFV0G_24085, partial [Kitasatospora sp. NPDC059571]